jgi:phytoene synthase
VSEPDACAALVREADKDRFLSALFAPADRRPALHALYAFDLEIASVRDRVSQPLPGEIRLQWWRDVIDGTRESGGDPVAAAIVDAAARYALPVAALHDLIDARTSDLYDEAVRTLADLRDYARRTSSALIALAMRILDGDGPDPGRGEAAGIADAVTRLLVALPRLAARGQVFVPEEVLARHGVRREEIFAGRSGPGLAAALRELRQEARRQLMLAREEVAGLPERFVPAMLPVAVTRLYLDRMERDDYSPFTTAIEVPQWRRQWAMWRAARSPGRIAG